MADKFENASVAFRAGKFRETVSLLRKVNEKKKLRSVASASLEAAAWNALGEPKNAVAVLKRLLDDKLQRSEFVQLCMELADALKASGRYKTALSYLARAEKLASGAASDELLFRRAIVHAEARQLRKSVTICQQLMMNEEFAVRASLLLIEVANSLSDLELLLSAFQTLGSRVSELNNNNLLAMLERSSSYGPETSQPFFDEANKRSLMPNRVRLFTANQARYSGDLTAANSLLAEVEESKLDASLKPLYWSIKGTLEDKQKDFDAAFNSFVKMNRCNAVLLPADWKKYLETKPFEVLRSVPDDYSGPVKQAFIVGFPRSGTTLLEVILDSQQGVAILEEKPVIESVKAKIREDGHTLADCLPQLTEDYLGELREYYFSQAKEYLKSDADVTVQLLVDKNPLQILDLPLIQTLFPRAKILLAIRHPLDCILSCFQQTFEANTQMPVFTDWQSSFEHYHNVFTAYREAKSQMNWTDHVVRYESIVSDFETEVKAVFEFLELSPDAEAYRLFSEQAKSRIVSTPSNNQVTQEIYVDSTYRWQNYMAPIAAHWDIVRDDIDWAGYDAAAVEAFIQTEKA